MIFTGPHKCGHGNVCDHPDPQSPWEEVKKEMVEEKGLSEEAADR